MAIIDLDSHLRDGWLLDEIYLLPEPFTKFSPKRIGDEKYFYSKFEHNLSPMEDPIANANFKKPVTHQVFYNPEANQRGNEVMRWQQGGYDMEYRMKDNAREGIDFQLIFPTQIDIPSQFLSSLPYVATIIVLVIISRNVNTIRLNSPASLGQPYRPDA